MWLNIFLVALGLVFLVAVMAFVLNPPEFWVKRAFSGKRTTPKGPEKPG